MGSFLIILLPDGAVDLPAYPQPAIVSHDGEVLVYAMLQFAKSDQALSLCVKYQPVPFHSTTGDGPHKANPKRKHRNVGAGLKQQPIDLEADDPNTLPTSPRAQDTVRGRGTVPPTYKAALPRQTPVPRAPAVDTTCHTAQEDDLPQHSQAEDDVEDYEVRTVQYTTRLLCLTSHLHPESIPVFPSKHRKLAQCLPSPDNFRDPLQPCSIGLQPRGVKRKIGRDDAPPQILQGFEADSSCQPRRPPQHLQRPLLSPHQGQRSRQAPTEQHNVGEGSCPPYDRQHGLAYCTRLYRHQDRGPDDDRPLAPLPRPQGSVRAGSHAPPDVQGGMCEGLRAPSDVHGYLHSGSRAIPAYTQMPAGSRAPLARSHAPRTRAVPQDYWTQDSRYLQDTFPLRMDYLQPARACDYRDTVPRGDLRRHDPVPYIEDNEEYYDNEEDEG